MVEIGVKMGSFHSLVHPKWSTISFGETHLRYILGAFLVPKQPIVKAFWDFPLANTRHNGLKTGQDHLIEHVDWCMITFGKLRF